MKVAIMQPYLFPYVGYWQLIGAADTFVILDDVNFIRRGWINRNRILQNGSEILFTLPVKNASQNRLISETSFTDDPKAYAKLLRMFAQAYAKAPFAGEMNEIAGKCLNFENRDVTALVKNQLETVTDYLGIKKDFLKASELRPADHRHAQEGILELCRITGADCYINPIGGTSLYEKEAFAKAGIELYFLHTDFEEAEKLTGGRRADLSVIDLIANCSKDTLRKLLGCYNLE